MKLRKLVVGLFLTVAALFIPVSTIRAATAPIIPESGQPTSPGLTYDYQSGSISVTASGTDGDAGDAGSNKGKVIADGTVTELGWYGKVTVMCDDGQTVDAVISGKLRMHYVRIMRGDRVQVEFSPDTMKGKVILRYRNT